MAKIVKNNFHRDAFGYMLELEDLVMYMPPNSNEMVLGRVKSFTPKMIKCDKLRSNGIQDDGVARFAKSVCLLHGNTVMKDWPDEWIIEMKKNPDTIERDN